MAHSISFKNKGTKNSKEEKNIELRLTNSIHKTINHSPFPSKSLIINDITIVDKENLWLCTQGCIDCSYKGGLTKYDRHNNWQTYNQTNSGIALDRDDSIVKIYSMGNK